MSLKFPLFLVALGFVACGGSSGSSLFQGGGTGATGGAGAAGAGTGGASSGGSSSGGNVGSGGDLATGGALGTGGDTGGSVGAGGAGPQDSGLHPPVECTPRAFSGTADGTNYATVLGPMTVKANITFSVTKTGEIIGTYTGTQPVTSHASLSGQMDCETLAVTLEITGGTYVAGFPPLGTSGTFSGTMTGTCEVGGCAGTWTVKENNPAYGGTGSWNVN